MVGIEEIRIAAKELTHGALKLYLYLCENVNEYSAWLSPKDICDKYNMSKSTYDRAKAELISKGYIVEEGNQVHFYANKNDSETTIQKIKEKVVNIGKRIEIKDEKEGEKFKKIILQANLKKLKEDNKIEYAKKLRELLVIGEEILSKLMDSDIEDLI